MRRNVDRRDLDTQDSLFPICMNAQHIHNFPVSFLSCPNFSIVLYCTSLSETLPGNRDNLSPYEVNKIFLQSKCFLSNRDNFSPDQQALSFNLQIRECTPCYSRVVLRFSWKCFFIATHYVHSKLRYSKSRCHDI